MKRLFICMTLLLIPSAGFAQQHFLLDEKVSSVVIKGAEVQPSDVPDRNSFHLVEPILTRKINYDQNSSEGFRLGQSPRAAFFSSLLIPGSGQLASRSWLRAGLFIAVEAAGIYLAVERSEEHTSELQSRGHLVCRLLLEKKKVQ